MTPDEFDGITLRVYRRRLEDECRGDAGRQLARIGEKGQRTRAMQWRGLVIATLIEAGLHDPHRPPIPGRMSRMERDANRESTSKKHESEGDAA